LIALTSRSARAFFIGIAEETGGTAYEWYAPSLPIYWNSLYNDGSMPDGRPYVKFEGTDASPQGHCLELAFQAPGDNYVSPGSIYVYVLNNGTYTAVSVSNVDAGAYPKLRVWMNHNAGPPGSSLNWALYFAPPDIVNPEVRAAFFGVTRLEVSKATCTTGSGLPWVSWEGQTSSYTLTYGSF
jgi:hypothetical protein